MKPAVGDCLNISYVCNDVAAVCILVGLGRKLCKTADLVLAHIPCIKGYRFEHRRRQFALWRPSERATEHELAFPKVVIVRYAVSDVVRSTASDRTLTQHCYCRTGGGGGGVKIITPILL
jgi:hypothetical protein